MTLHSTSTDIQYSSHDGATTIGNSSSEVLAAEMAATWQWRIDTDPELAAVLGFLSKRTMPHALDPRSMLSFQQRNDYVQQALDRIQKNVNRNELNKFDQLSFDLYVQQLSDYVSYSPKHMGFLNCINRLEGPQPQDRGRKSICPCHLSTREVLKSALVSKQCSKPLRLRSLEWKWF
jgi:hypothetical protein